MIHFHFVLQYDNQTLKRMTTYRSKLGPELIIPVFMLTGGTGILMAVEQIWLGFALIVFLLAFIIHLFLTTYYQVDGNTLNIRCGFFLKISINIDTIKTIRETRNPISAPATSLDRIEISYNKYNTVLISPKYKEAFIRQLTAINPGIAIILKERPPKE